MGQKATVLSHFPRYGWSPSSRWAKLKVTDSRLQHRKNQPPGTQRLSAPCWSPLCFALCLSSSRLSPGGLPLPTGGTPGLQLQTQETWCFWCLLGLTQSGCAADTMSTVTEAPGEWLRPRPSGWRGRGPWDKSTSILQVDLAFLPRGLLRGPSTISSSLAS